MFKVPILIIFSICLVAVISCSKINEENLQLKDIEDNVYDDYDYKNLGYPRFLKMGIVLDSMEKLNEIIRFRKDNLRNIEKLCEQRQRNSVLRVLENLTEIAYGADKLKVDVTYTLFNSTYPAQKAPGKGWTGGKAFTMENFRQEIGTNLSSRAKLKFIVHGFQSSANESWLHRIGKAFVAKDDGDVSYITVDWKYQRQMNPSDYIYIYPAGSTLKVAARITELITEMLDAYSTTLNLSKIQLIGHDLGAQIMGYVGSNFKENEHHKDLVIVGLDPAVPLFEFAPNCLALNISDAGFVQIIHTNAMTLGSVNARGHVDIYVDGGYLQERCKLERDVLRKHFAENLCSHSMATAYFAECVRNPSRCIAYRCANYEDFVAFKCFNCQDNPDNCKSIGSVYRPRSPTTSFGKYYINTKLTGKNAFGYHVAITIQVSYLNIWVPEAFRWLVIQFDPINQVRLALRDRAIQTLQVMDPPLENIENVRLMLEVGGRMLKSLTRRSQLKIDRIVFQNSNGLRKCGGELVLQNFNEQLLDLTSRNCNSVHLHQVQNTCPLQQSTVCSQFDFLSQKS